MFGERFTTQHCGDVVVCEYLNCKHVTVVFINTGYVLQTTKRALVSTKTPRLRDPNARTVFDVGYIGEGPHKAHTNSADTKPFSIWRAMLRRCYYAPERTSWRAGQTVTPEWHCFQTFARWYESNYPEDGGRYQLDKDLTIPGNKIYSPAACRFVTQAQNLAGRQFKRDRLVAAQNN